jgi:hypothetical protein
MPFSMAEIVNDPDFAQSFTITRSSGSFVKGNWDNIPTTVQGYGVIQPATPKELSQIPDGDRVTGAVSFHSSQALYETHLIPSAGTSDTIAWNSQNYRLVKVFPWQDFGYYKAIGVRMSGA